MHFEDPQPYSTITSVDFVYTNTGDSIIIIINIISSPSNKA